MILDILITLFLVFLNGFFVAAEFAIVKVRLSQIELIARAGNPFAPMAKKIVEHLDAYLSATQLGITLASLGLGWVGEPVVAKAIGEMLHAFGMQFDPDTLHKIALPIAFAIITVLHIVLGELAPKSLAIQRPETVTLATSIPLRFFYIVFKPFIWSLNSIANRLLRLLGVEPGLEQELHSAEEIRYLIEESSKGGMMEISETELISNVFDFGETTASSIMVPRGNVCAIDINLSGEQMFAKVLEEGYSRMPVYQGSIDNILGVVYAKDLVMLMSYRNLIVIQDIMRPAFFVQEGDKIKSILREMQRRKVHLAIVTDEFGGTAGIITLENIMEELVGDIQDEYDEEKPDIVKKSDTEWKVESTVSIADINDRLPFPLPESDEYETVGGLLNKTAGYIPEEQEIFKLGDYEAIIIRRTKRRVEQIKLKLIKKVHEDQPSQ